MSYKNQTDRWSKDSRGIWWYEYGKTHAWGKRTKTKGLVGKCLLCGDEFLTLPQRQKEIPQKGCYCSRSCARKARPGFCSRGIKGKNHYAWKGGRRIERRGYVLLYNPDHPHCVSGKYVREHRLVMEKSLGRYLEPYEYVHHKNGVKSDNRLENLEIVSAYKHEGEIKCPHCLKTFLIR